MVGVEDEVILARFLKDRLVAGAAPIRRGGGDDQRSAAFGEGLAVLIEVGPGDLARAAHNDVVSTLDAAAAEIVGDEENPPVFVADDERSFDGAVDGCRSGAATERVEGGVLIRRLAGVGVETAHLDADRKST